MDHHIIKVYAVIGDYGNVGPGRVLGLFENKDEAENNTIGCGSLDGGGDGHVEERYVLNADHCYYILAHADPVLLNILEPSQAKAIHRTDEKTGFRLVLKSIGKNRISVIKEIKAITGMGLLETMSLSGKPNAVLKSGLSLETANLLVDRFSFLGAKTLIE
jgi:ribosomal protein L7/L12